MAVDEAPKPAAGPADPNDLSAYNLDTYDEEESKGAGQFKLAFFLLSNRLSFELTFPCFG